jgi:hypothetical protein
MNEKQRGHVIEGSKKIKDTVWVDSKTQEEGKKQAFAAWGLFLQEPVSQDHSTIRTRVS